MESHRFPQLRAGAPSRIRHGRDYGPATPPGPTCTRTRHVIATSTACPHGTAATPRPHTWQRAPSFISARVTRLNIHIKLNKHPRKCIVPQGIQVTFTQVILLPLPRPRKWQFLFGTASSFSNEIRATFRPQPISLIPCLQLPKSLLIIVICFINTMNRKP